MKCGKHLSFNEIGAYKKFVNRGSTSFLCIPCLAKKLDIPEGYQLLYCIAFGYPDETPSAKPRNAEKIRFID